MNLTDEDRRIEEELKGKRLICEMAFDHCDFDMWRRHLPQDFGAWRYPFVAAVMTVAVGVLEYEQGDYWHSFKWLTTPGDQTRWGKEFETFLEKNETLETFKVLRESGGHRYVAPILAHGGVPQYCLKDFFVLVTHNADYELPSNDFIELLKAHRSCLQTIDKPVQRFLLYGGEAAEEFVARFLALWESLDRGEAGGAYGLPKRVVDAFGDWYAVHGTSRQLRQRKRNRPKAAIFIKPGDLGVYLYLPSCDIDPEIGKRVYWKALNKSWAISSSHEIPLSFSNEWIVEIEGEKDTLKGITSSLPVMFFARETGRLISDPKLRRLPENLWAVYSQTSQASPSPCYWEPLAEWPGYGIAVFDLSNHKTLCVDGHEFEIRRPFFQVGEDPVVRGFRTEKGLPIFYRTPEIKWEGRVNLTLVKDGDNQGSIDIEPHDFDIWFTEPGEYNFHLRGPLGQNVSKHFFLLPGLSFRTYPQVRWPKEEGFNLEISAHFIEFRSEKDQPPPFWSVDSKLYFRAFTKSTEFQLIFEIPSLGWRFIGADPETSQWTNKPLGITVQELQQCDYPRLVIELKDVEFKVDIFLISKQGDISAPKGSQSVVSIQNIWTFDLRQVRDQVIESGRAEKFDVLIQDINGNSLYQGMMLSVRPQWDISNFQAKWGRAADFQTIHVSWIQHGPTIADRYLVLIPLWRPFDGAFDVHHLSENENFSFTWQFHNLRPGRYVIRAVHAPWGCEDWLNAQCVCQRKLDVFKEGWEEIFSQCKDESVSMEDYLESLLAYWHRPDLVKNPPSVPKGVAADQIKKFLEGFELVNNVEKIHLPGSDALNLFCLNPLATTEVASTARYFSDIWQNILPSYNILTLDPSQQDKKFIHEIAFQYDILSTAARSVKCRFKKRWLSCPLQLWHKYLLQGYPPAGDVFFLCEKFGLFSDDTGRTINKDFGPGYKQVYEEFKHRYIRKRNNRRIRLYHIRKYMKNLNRGI